MLTVMSFLTQRYRKPDIASPALEVRRHALADTFLVLLLRAIGTSAIAADVCLETQVSAMTLPMSRMS